ncbi:MAG: hypothetical protein HY551_02280 [Elusimicrobia bacterium]|nr:hypothetical protein [Elusimicrobiota bacterium]
MTSSAYELRARHEIVFCVFLLVLAFLFRDNPAIVYPRILHVFAGLLAFNFIFNRFLRQPQASAYLSSGAIFVNGILIHWAIHCTGGQDSYLWVMYLLPIFTACLLLGPWGVVLTTLYAVSLNAVLYCEIPGKLGSLDWLHILSRTGLFLLAASVTSQLARSERFSQQACQQQREKLEEALRKTRLGGKLLAEDSSHPDVGQALHGMNSALTVILGSVQIMMSERNFDGPALQDLRRVESAARRCGKMLKELSHGPQSHLHSRG